MEKIKVAIVGYGNVGQGAADAIRESKDMELVGIVAKPKYVDKIRQIERDLPIVTDPAELPKTDVAILAIGSRAVSKIAPIYLKMGINTVDAYDIHGEPMMRLRDKLRDVAIDSGSVAIIAAGWDPGTDSVIRALFEVIAPKGVTNINFGPGMSMGHTVVVKAIDGVKDALSITVPKGAGLHRRMVYVELEEGASFEKISETIKADPYFIKDETHVFRVESVKDLADVGHGVYMDRKGVAGKTHNQKIELTMSITNPAATGQILVSAARASMKQKPGCYSMLEIPPIDFLSGSKKENLKRLI